MADNEKSCKVTAMHEGKAITFEGRGYLVFSFDDNGGMDTVIDGHFQNDDILAIFTQLQEMFGENSFNAAAAAQLILNKMGKDKPSEAEPEAEAAGNIIKFPGVKGLKQ